MAATNFTPIQLYFSTTASAVPTAANLAQGELAINIADGKLYYEDSAGVVQVIATKGSGTIGGSTTQIQYNNAGALAGNAAMVFNSGTSTTTLTTLNLTNALGATYGGTAQSTYAQGDFLYASAANTLSKLGIGANTYILTSTGSVPQWVAPSSIAVLTATNLAGGLAGSVPYQSAVDTTTFLSIGAANRVMTSTGSAPQWVTSLTGLTGVSSSGITNTSLTSGRVVVSTTGGLQADDSDLTFDGTTLSAGGLSTGGLSTLVKTVKIGDSSFNGVAIFAAATPAKLYMGTGTVTDVTSAASATNTTGAIATLGITPIAATNVSVTYTNASTLYIAGAPSAGTNITITNPYSLYVAGGASYFGGAVDFAVTPSYSGGTANGVAYLDGSKVLTTGSALTFDGSQLGIGTASGTSNGLKLNSGNAGANYVLYRASATGLLTIYGNQTGFNGLTVTGIDGDLATLTSSGLEVKQSQLIGYSSYAGLGSYGLAVAGNVGIGTSSPEAKLQVVSSGATGATISAYDATASKVFFQAGGTQYIQVGSTATTTFINDFFGTSLSFRMADSEKMRLDSLGNLGLGVTPSASWSNLWSAEQFGQAGTLFSYKSGSNYTALSNNSYASGGNYQGADAKYTNDGYSTAYVQNNSGEHLWLRAPSGTAGDPITFTQAMTLTAAGYLGIGVATTTPAYYLDARSGSAANTASFVSTDSTAYTPNAYNGDKARIFIQGGGATGATTGFEFTAGGSNESYFGVVQEAAGAGAFVFQGYNGSAYAERARITSGGDLRIGLTTPVYNTERLTVYKSGDFEAAAFTNEAGANNYTVAVSNRATTGDNKFMVFATESSDTTRGSITYNRAGGLVAYNVTSDYRAKDISGPVTGSGALIDSVPVYMGKMKDATQERPMFIAHETPAYAHTGEKDAVDKDGKPVYQQMDASALIPVMWAEIQDLRKRLAAAGI